MSYSEYLVTLAIVSLLVAGTWYLTRWTIGGKTLFLDNMDVGKAKWQQAVDRLEIEQQDILLIMELRKQGCSSRRMTIPLSYSVNSSSKQDNP
jgi:hypothetical protein